VRIHKIVDKAIQLHPSAVRKVLTKHYVYKKAKNE
jgi:hypothetical protein